MQEARPEALDIMEGVSPPPPPPHEPLKLKFSLMLPYTFKFLLEIKFGIRI
jgi:hypothetical protein